MARTLAFINPRLTTTNVGDLFIEDSAKRVLSYDPDTSFDVDPRRPISPAELERINRADAAVILGTNLWYREMPRPSRWQFRLDDLKRIRVPIIPLGVGTTRHDGEDNGFEPETREQLRVIHASCTLASARDPRTAEALAEAGIRNIAVTGCPTLFRTLRPAWTLRRRTDTRQVVLTVRKGQRHNVQDLLRLARRRGLQPVVAAQQDRDQFLARPSLFFRAAAPTLFRFEMPPYLRLVDASCGALGWRLHGNMLHLAHGRPAILMSNCSRGASFCELFGLPVVPSPDHCRLGDTVLSEMLDRFFDDDTFAPLAKRYGPVRDEMIRFLEANELEHNLRPAPVLTAA
ncbi:MAG: polysaccharide pyruvyl transferase family protein [Gemmataceae bacterium]|nr:polysaccharide pyruvyl transferase family protein [Gemmataceae bacterium]